VMIADAQATRTLQDPPGPTATYRAASGARANEAKLIEN